MVYFDGICVLFVPHPLGCKVVAKYEQKFIKTLHPKEYGTFSTTHIIF
jgi:hypothetical protein